MLTLILSCMVDSLVDMFHVNCIQYNVSDGPLGTFGNPDAVDYDGPLNVMTYYDLSRLTIHYNLSCHQIRTFVVLTFCVNDGSF